MFIRFISGKQSIALGLPSSAHLSASAEECSKCHESYNGFGTVCAACRKLKTSGTSRQPGGLGMLAGVLVERCITSCDVCIVERVRVCRRAQRSATRRRPHHVGSPQLGPAHAWLVYLLRLTRMGKGRCVCGHRHRSRGQSAFGFGGHTFGAPRLRRCLPRGILLRARACAHCVSGRCL